MEISPKLCVALMANEKSGEKSRWKVDLLLGLVVACVGGVTVGLVVSVFSIIVAEFQAIHREQLQHDQLKDELEAEIAEVRDQIEDHIELHRIERAREQ